MRILSNDLDAPAREIVDLYKRPWQIELFFRVMKQTLKISPFIGRSEKTPSAFRSPSRLIAFLLLQMLNKMSQEKTNPARDHWTRTHQPNASKRLHPIEPITSAAPDRLTTDHAKLGINMSRTRETSPAIHVLSLLRHSR